MASVVDGQLIAGAVMKKIGDLVPGDIDGQA